MPICTRYRLVDLTPKYPTLVASTPGWFGLQNCDRLALVLERASLLAHELLVRVGPTHMECASDQRGKPQPWQAKASYPTLTLP